MSKNEFQSSEKKLSISANQGYSNKLSKIDANEILSLLEKNAEFDDLISKILDERLSLEKNKFKVAAISIVLKRLERAKSLLESLDRVEEEIFGNRLTRMSSAALVNLYREINQNVRYMVELLSHYDEYVNKSGLQVNLVQQLNSSSDVVSASQKVENNVEINALEAIRRLGEILSNKTKDLESIKNSETIEHQFFDENDLKTKD